MRMRNFLVLAFAAATVAGCADHKPPPFEDFKAEADRKISSDKNCMNPYLTEYEKHSGGYEWHFLYSLPSECTGDSEWEDVFAVCKSDNPDDSSGTRNWELGPNGFEETADDEIRCTLSTPNSPNFN